MKLRRSGLRLVNWLLSPARLQLSSEFLDFEAHLGSPKQLQFLVEDLAKPIEEWINSQRLFTPAIRPLHAAELIERFYHQYLDSPFRVPAGGSRFNNLLWLYLLAHAMQPTVIVDSGTYTGGSAWALSLGAPHSPVVSFDLDLSQLKLRRPRVRYVESDWMGFDVSDYDVSRGLCYFDDHVDQIARLIQAASRRFPVAIFDDDFRVTSYHPSENVRVALPKIEFLLDPRLCDGETISWLFRGRMHTWRVDRAYLDQGRKVIQSTDRLPDTSLITGIQQTPYRVVALKPDANSHSDGPGVADTAGRRNGDRWFQK